MARSEYEISYERIVRAYRTPRETPRFPQGVEVMEDPAPDWVWKTAEVLLSAMTGEIAAEAMTAAAIRWCAEEGANHEARAKQLITLVLLWPGPPKGRVALVDRFLCLVRQTKAGARGKNHVTAKLFGRENELLDLLAAVVEYADPNERAVKDAKAILGRRPRA